MALFGIKLKDLEQGFQSLAGSLGNLFKGPQPSQPSQPVQLPTPNLTPGPSVVFKQPTAPSIPSPSLQSVSTPKLSLPTFQQLSQNLVNQAQFTAPKLQPSMVQTPDQVIRTVQTEAPKVQFSPEQLRQQDLQRQRDEITRKFGPGSTASFLPTNVLTTPAYLATMGISYLPQKEQQQATKVIETAGKPAEAYNQALLGGLGREVVDITAKTAPYVALGPLAPIALTANVITGGKALPQLDQGGTKAAEEINKRLFPEPGTQKSLSPTKLEDYTSSMNAARLAGSVSKTAAELGALGAVETAAASALKGIPFIAGLAEGGKASQLAGKIIPQAIASGISGAAGRYGGGLAGNAMFVEPGKKESASQAVIPSLKFGAAQAVTTGATGMIPKVGNIPILSNIPRRVVGAVAGGVTAPWSGTSPTAGAVFGAFGLPQTGKTDIISKLQNTRTAKEVDNILSSYNIKFPGNMRQTVAEDLAKTNNKKVIQKYLVSAANEADNINIPKTTETNIIGGIEVPATTGKKITTTVPIDLADTQTIRNKIFQGMVEADAPILKRARDVEKMTGQTGLVDKILYNTGLVQRSNSIANQQIANNPNLKNALGGLNRKQLKQFNEYAAARAELDNAAKGMSTSKNVSELQNIVNLYDAAYGQRFQSLNKYYHDMADWLYAGGKIDKATLDKWKSDNNYIRIQRDMGDYVNANYGRGGAGASSGKSQFFKKRLGSQKEILPADVTALETTQRVAAETTKNQAANDIIDVLAQGGMARNLVNADNVLFRQKVWSFLKDTKGIKTFIANELRKSSRELRVIQTELNRLNKAGLQESLKGAQPTMAGFNPNLLPKLNTRDVRGTIKSLIVEDPAKLKRIRDMIARRDPKAAALLDRVAALRDELSVINEARSQAYQEALNAADSPTARKNTIRRTVNGVVEVWEVPADVKKAVDKISPYQLGIIGKIVAYPKKVFQAGTTGLNLPFSVVNFLRDQATSGINSKNIYATHNPFTIFSGLYEANKDFYGLKNDSLWTKFLTVAGDTTQFDALRNVESAKKMSREIRRGAKGKLTNAVLSPVDTVANFVSITEKATRFQNFKGIYNDVLKKTGNKDEALRQATLAAWQNSVDFNRMGTWGKAINLVIPYFNAGIQGSRQLVKTFKTNPVGAFTKTLGLVGTPLIGLTAYNLLDPQRREIYNNIPDYEKQNNLILILPNAEQNDQGKYEGIIKIPMPQGYGDLMTPARRLLESYVNQEPVDGLKIAGDIFNTVSGPVPINQGPEQIASTLTPQFAKPSIQQWANKDLYTGKPIVPDYINQATDQYGNPIPESEKAYKNQSGSIQMLGQITGQSPIRLQKFITDTFGRSSGYIINSLDNALAAGGVIPQEQIGGTSVVSDFQKRMFQAQSIENFNKTEGQKYYDNIKEVTQNMTQNELNAFNLMHPTKKNFLGDVIYNADSTYNPTKKLAIYNQFPKVYEADKKLNELNVASGNPNNPFFDLPFDYARKVLEKEALPQGAKDPELDKLYQQEWYVDYKKAKTDYYNELKANADAAGRPFAASDNPYPQATAQLQAAMDQYSSLPKGTGARSNWIRNNPDIFNSMKDYWAAIDNWQNNERAKRGLAATEGAAGVAAGYAQASGTTSTSNKGKYYPKFYIPGGVKIAKPGGLQVPQGRGRVVIRKPGKIIVRTQKG